MKREDIDKEITRIACEIDAYEGSTSAIPRHQSDLIDGMRLADAISALKNLVYSDIPIKVNKKEVALKQSERMKDNFEVFRLIGKKYPQWTNQLKGLREEWKKSIASSVKGNTKRKTKRRT